MWNWRAILTSFVLAHIISTRTSSSVPKPCRWNNLRIINFPVHGLFISVFKMPLYLHRHFDSTHKGRSAFNTKTDEKWMIQTNNVMIQIQQKMYNKINNIMAWFKVCFKSIFEEMECVIPRSHIVGQTWKDLNERGLIGWDLLGRESGSSPHVYP